MTAERQLDPATLGDHVDRLYRAAWGLCGSREQAEDLVQDTFAHVLRKPRFLRADDDIGYLLRVLRNTFISQRRAAARRPQAVEMPEGFEVADERPGGQPERRLERRELYAEIAELPEHFRDALIAVDLVGLSYREAARTLRVREATLTTRLHRGRQALGRSLSASSNADLPGGAVH